MQIHDLKWALMSARNEYYKLLDVGNENKNIEFLNKRIKTLENEIKRQTILEKKKKAKPHNNVTIK